MRWRWSESRPGMMYVIAALMLELLPFEAALLLVTASDDHPIDAAAVPLWFSIGALIAACSAGRALRGRPRSRVSLLSSPGIAAAYLLLVYVSPAALAGAAGNPLHAPPMTATNGHDPMSVLGALLAANCYLWFRGLTIGEGVPHLDVVLRRFRNGLAVLVVVMLALPAIAATERAALVGVLTLVLPGEIFFGLMATSTARLIAQQESARADGTARPWLALSTVVAGTVVGVALLFALILDGAALHEALRHMGPLGDALATVASTIGQAVATALRVVLGGVFSLVHITPITRSVHPVQPPTVCTGARCRQAVKPSVAFGVVLDVLLGLVAVTAIVFVAYVAYRLVRGLSSRPEPQAGIQEEREMLDGRAIFADQLRGLLGHRRPLGSEHGEETLPPGTVRALYRDLLAVAASRGLPRRTVETPDEYAARLAASPSPVGHDAGTAHDGLAILTDAYDDARYGQREPDAARLVALRQRLARVIASLPSGR